MPLDEMNTNSTKIFSWKVAVLLSFGIGLVTVGLSVFLQTRILTVEAFSAEAPKSVAPVPTQAVAAAAAIVPVPVGLGASFEMPLYPVQPSRLLIPSIGVDAHIQSVGLSWRGNGDMGVPTNFTDVAWYNQGPLPGMPGSAVIDGHMDGKNVAQAVFYNLN